MAHRRLSALAVVVTSTLLSYALCVPNSSGSRSETFSTVVEVAGQGPAGSELYLEETGAHVTATLRDYLGDSQREVTKLLGTISQAPAGSPNGNCAVTLAGRGPRGRVEIKGEISPARFTGLVTRQVGGDVFSHRISLRRRPPSNDSAAEGVLAAIVDSGHSPAE